MDQNLVSRPVRMPEGDAATELFHSGGEDSVRLKLDYDLFPVFINVDWGDFIVRDVEIAKEIVASWEPEFAPWDASWNFGEIEKRGVFPDEQWHGGVWIRDDLVRRVDLTDELVSWYTKMDNTRQYNYTRKQIES